jgi:hypothetical protein
MEANMTCPCRPSALKVAMFLCVLGAVVGGAQKPAAAQASAIRTACQEDFIAHCPGVKPDGSEALACLRKHSALLSPNCQTALSKAPTRPSKRQIIESRARSLYYKYRSRYRNRHRDDDDD